MNTKQLTINENWKFHLGDCEPAWYKGYDDSGWPSVSLPHDWSVERPFAPAYSSGTGYVAGGIGWYRGRFSLPGEWKGKCVRLVFDGVYKNSQVWCNSYYLGRRPNGYVSFSYDITPFARFGAENEISVKVTHTDLADSRWFTGSGITRSVRLVVQEPLHPAQDGIFFGTEEISFEEQGFACGYPQTEDAVGCAVEENGGLSAGSAGNSGQSDEAEPSFAQTDAADILSAQTDAAEIFSGRAGVSSGQTQKDAADTARIAKSARVRVALELVNDLAAAQSRQDESAAKKVTAAAQSRQGESAAQSVTAAPQSRQDAAAAQKVTATAQLLDGGGRVVLEMTGDASVEPAALVSAKQTVHSPAQTEGVGAKLTLNGTLENPHLWSVQDPYLYRLRMLLAPEGQEAYTVYEEAVGVRSIRFDADHGFFLNEQPMKLLGVCVHHDGGCLGAAMTAEVWQRRLSTLKECGCNAIRCSHNPHMPELYALCDRMGFLMMDEAFDEWENPKNKWSTGHNVYPPRHQGYFEEFPQWHEADLKAMVRRDRNHPSVILWSIGNEIDYPNDPYCHPSFAAMTGNNDANKPAAERQYDPDKPDASRLAALAARLSGMVRQEDPDRPVTLAAAFPELSANLGFLDSLDVAGYNYKEHLYAEHHARRPLLPLLGSENGHDYAAWKAVRDNEYISGQFLWTGIDYLGEAHGWPVRGSMAGLLTTAGDRKPEFYQTASFWKTEPVLHISTKPVQEAPEGRQAKWIPMQDFWNYEEGQAVEIICMSNAAEIALSLNGKEIGRQKRSEEDGMFTFTAAFEAGELKAEAFDEKGVLLRTASLSATGRAQKLQTALWQAADVLTGKSQKEAGQERGYLYQIQAELLDADGRRCTADDQPLTVEVTGGGVLAGLENGNLADVTPYAAPARSTWLGRLTVYVRRTRPGAIRVRIFADKTGGVPENVVGID